MKITPARLAAYEILLKIEREKAFSSILLPVYEARLEAKDRALCHELVLGTLRRQIYLDRLIEELTGGKKLDREVRVILRLGAYQLLALDRVPAHAAINEAVNLAQKAKKTSAKALVNAVLRRVSRGAPAIESAGETARIALETSHPEWLIERWRREFGAADAENLARANNENAPAAYRYTAKTTEAIVKSLDGQNAEAEKSYLRELAANGKIYFQDEASQTVARAVRLRPGESFLDVCAAPGSKTTYIAALGSDESNRLFAGDLHDARVRVLAENCRLQGVRDVRFAQYDAAAALPFADESVDAVLVDAPCSGTGTIRHNPEIRYFLAENDFAPLQTKQLAILANASKLIKPGGRLIYSTCSLEREENERVAALFAARHAEFELQRPEVPERFLTGEGYARTLPHRDRMDGFFIAVFEKR